MLEARAHALALTARAILSSTALNDNVRLSTFYEKTSSLVAIKTLTIMNLNTLEQLGLHNHEICIYLVLLMLSSVSFKDIAVQADINRGTTCEKLKQLAAKGIVSYFPRRKCRAFCAEPSGEIIEFSRRKIEARDE